MPRCLMAAKLENVFDPTGENTLKHWIAVGQIQDGHVLVVVSYSCCVL